MKKYILFVLTLFTFLTLVSACTEDIVIPDPEGPIHEVPSDTTDTPSDDPTEDPTDEPTDEPSDNPDDEPAEEPTDEPTEDPNDNPIPGNGSVPGGMVGNWTQGTFSLTEFWNYDGSYAGNASEQSNVFVFKDNGECEQYFIMTQRMYNCKTEAYTYKKGTVEFNEADGSFTFTPASGKARGFYSCAPSSNFSRDSRPEELEVKTYYYEMVQMNGKEYMLVKFNRNDANGSYFQKNTW
ncbi:PT domain-containing protein [Rhodocytophaga aerolata]|uniref:PT domain-containing protein n=1 Tax=Rhodocytophaga aerolata TaxID=455078 RepID=A0ABT8R0U4_9BACT|nr:PT domain-containing protein [Rhodocytophaga aerolata]MDO1444938.1 PT domain-containing protein [Rhodocytophaga aerolata]